MTKLEFCELLGAPVSDGFYRDIETVYTYHPSISETEGKMQVVRLFKEFGFRIFADMLPTAQRAKDKEDFIRAARFRLQELEDDYKLFRCGVT